MRDLRFALRILAQQPAFTAVAVLTLALGIGADTAIFTLFNAILLESLPVREPSRLVLFSGGDGEGTSTGDYYKGRWNLFSLESFEYLRQQPLPFASIAAIRSGEDPVSVRIPDAAGDLGGADRAQAHLVSGDYFTVMGVRAALGRMLTRADDRLNAPATAVVSYGFFADRLHADRSIVGRVVSVNGTAFTIVGVTPPEFFGERVRRPPDLWVPLSFQPQIELRPSYLDRADAYWLNLIARLAPGSTRGAAESQSTSALQQFVTAKEGSKLTDARRNEIRNVRVELVDGAGGISGLRFRYSQPLRILLVVVTLVLLIACANVGNLLLSRAAARQPEISVRLALGATRGRLLRQMLTESALLATGGAIAGLLLARWMVRIVASQIVGKGTPVHAALDGRVLAFTIAATGLAAIVFGIIPAIAAGRTDLASAIKASGRAASVGAFGARAARVLVVAQIATSLVLVAGANLFARNLLNLEQQPLGFDREHVLLVRVNPRLAGYTPEAVGVLYRKLYDRIVALPGVTTATMARYSPMGGSRSTNSGTVEGYVPPPDEQVEFETIQVGSTFPQTLGIPVLAGRALGPLDAGSAPKVAMVNDAFARHFFPNGNAIGRHFGFGDNPREYEIVGILANVRYRDDATSIKPAVFPAILQDQSQYALDAEIAIRTAGDPALAAGELRRAIASVDPNVPVNDPKTLRAQVAANFDTQRLAAS